MDEDLARDALRSRERDLRARRRARRTAPALVVLAVAALGWQLTPAATSWWPFLTEWWPLVAAVVALVAAGVLWSRSLPRPAAAGSRAADRWSRIGGMVTTVTALGALVFTAISLQATRDQIEVARQGQITDRYTRAVDQLGAEGAANLHRRLGGSTRWSGSRSTCRGTRRPSSRSCPRSCAPPAHAPRVSRARRRRRTWRPPSRC
ncbi:hypothetical protein [Amycolatopsis thermoflava]|uniref:hypothetical protein n=1 Tax=Amycolatopsis thermoflava TaxID=84480 RepID=UPI003EBA2C91